MNLLAFLHFFFIVALKIKKGKNRTWVAEQNECKELFMNLNDLFGLFKPRKRREQHNLYERRSNIPFFFLTGTPGESEELSHWRSYDTT